VRRRSATARCACCKTLVSSCMTALSSWLRFHGDELLGAVLETPLTRSRSSSVPKSETTHYPLRVQRANFPLRSDWSLLDTCK